MKPDEKVRCPWCLKDDIYKRYHDEVWGVPEHDDRKLFAKLILDGAQAGLSWYTILIRTESYAKAYNNWDAKKVARYGEKDVERLMNDAGIIRNRSKIMASISNAQAYLKIMEDGPGSFDRFLWKHVHGKTKVNRVKQMSDVPVSTPESDAMSNDLKKHGFKFTGTTIVYAFMQACGMVDDHMVTCWRKKG
ncbi:MAG: DNA-3-methyladenine glycosylase I [Flavobacteriales bacterium]|nr:DNA-3-methyladenine glycosylase I [Flavobacteriales bacterium]MBK7246211.1 DNA-3-methyladenine glycosylase I [Flavobacteriales bacterium]QQS71910.1 MAG: DNA-3-methyladenine glycosylase I [Flavobacteriales bacterium]HQV37691.1 DNA-3-methyladenine glycosylase I [Flavobacteriales bacterium]HQW30827.1 DNA-3-methyladenine glycosylase I [Flavobacteriales bacterium]